MYFSFQSLKTQVQIFQPIGCQFIHTGTRTGVEQSHHNSAGQQIFCKTGKRSNLCPTSLYYNAYLRIVFANKRSILYERQISYANNVTEKRFPKMARLEEWFGEKSEVFLFHDSSKRSLHVLQRVISVRNVSLTKFSPD